jgi:hypothetical protein
MILVLLILAFKNNATNYKIVNNMKRFVTRTHSINIINFSLAILFSILSIFGTIANASDRIIGNKSDSYATLGSKNKIANEKTLSEITLSPTGVTNLKLTSATIEATITDPSGTITDRGVVWSTTSGVAMTSNKFSEGGTTDGTFDVNLSGLDRSKTIYFKAYFTDGSGTQLSDESSFSNVPVFTGTGLWNDLARWNVKEIPTNTTGDSTIIDGICTVGDLTINSGAKLTIKSSRVLNVTGFLANNAGISGLIIQSDSTHANGTLTYQNGSPSATVEMYSKASEDLYQTDGSRYSWQYFGIPVKTFTLTNAFSTSFIMYYNDAATVDADLWKNQRSPLLSGVGYELVQPAPTTYEFTGELTNANFTTPVTYLAGTSYPGQHIFGNPFTAAIDITAIQFDANTENSVYLYNTGTYNQWFDNRNDTINGTDSIPGEYTVSTPVTAGVLGVPSQIPSMQGFLVKTLNTIDGSITIPYIGGVIPNTYQQRAPGKIKNVVSEKIATRIDLSGSHKADCMWLFTDSTCSTKFDNGWDGYKMKVSNGTPQLYAMETSGDYQIDALSDINGTTLGFVSGQETDYKLTFTHLNAEKRYTGIYLVDLVKNVTTDITSSGSEYAFTSEPAQVPIKRFKIVTSPEVNTQIPQITSLMKVFNSSGTLFIQNRSNQNGNLTLYNMKGVAVQRMEFKANTITTFSTSNLVPGAYVANAITNLEKVTERIIIR